jgi:hypothetical protein
MPVREVWVHTNSGQFLMKLDEWIRYPIPPGTSLSKALFFHPPSSRWVSLQFWSAGPRAEMYRDLDLILGDDPIPAHECFLIDEAEARLTFCGAGIPWPLPETKTVPPVPGEGDLVSYAPVSPLLQDLEWRRQFRAAIQCFLDDARVLSRNLLPGFPTWMLVSQLRLSYAVLRDHLRKVSDHNYELRDKHGVFVIGPLDPQYMYAYQWACGLVDNLRLTDPPPEPNQSLPPFDPATIPTQAELESLQAILDMIPSCDSQDDQKTKPCWDRDNREPWSLKPRWDRDSRELWYGETLCRKYSRENASNQFLLLDTFQASSWHRSVDSPFKLVRTLRETKDDLNGGLKETGSPIRFKVEEKKPTWFLQVAPACSG